MIASSNWPGGDRHTCYGNLNEVVNNPYQLKINMAGREVTLFKKVVSRWS